jgi:hypothetical protein
MRRLYDLRGIMVISPSFVAAGNPALTIELNYGSMISSISAGKYTNIQYNSRS